MITEFLGAKISFRSKLRDDAEDGGYTTDLIITLSSQCDAPFEQKTHFPCISEKDIDSMIGELKLCKALIHKNDAAAQGIIKAKTKLK